ncbi:MAG: DUF1573 domain-containing protein [Chitinophagales bacterium]
MKKSYLLSIIVILAVLNLLMFSCQNDNTTQKNTNVVEETTANHHTDSVTIEEVITAIEDSTNATIADENEAAIVNEEAEKKTETKIVAEKKTEKKAVTMNMPATPPKPQKPAAPVAQFKFDEKEYNFGTVKVGTKVEHDYYFTNTGEVPLIIVDANSTCGCTIPEVPTEPIPPGGRSKVKVTFDSTGKIGMQDKHVTIIANTSPQNTVIHLKGLALTENMMPTKTATTASPSPYASPKLSEPDPTPAKEEIPTNDDGKTTSDQESSMMPTVDKPAASTANKKDQ